MSLLERDPLTIPSIMRVSQSGAFPPKQRLQRAHSSLVSRVAVRCACIPDCFAMVVFCVENSHRKEDDWRTEDLVQVLGYLNFSSGKTDYKTLQALNRLYRAALAGNPYEGMPAWLQIQQSLLDLLPRLPSAYPAFQECSQASSVVEVLWSHLLPGYIDFHRDLLFHQEPEGIFNGFFLGRAMEAVLQQGGPWNETDRIVEGAVRHLNDYVGYRPVAVLEGRRLEPYPHEWVRPIPLFIMGAGITAGPYEMVISQAIQILGESEPDILHRACFDFAQLEELALDPRAYDFDHPVNRRPNYHFGQWDPNLVDSNGNYRRFVIQQVTLDALLARMTEEKKLSKSELAFEAAAVLAGTILMASGISGGSPTTYSSNVTLASLLPTIAQYRDEFYEHLLDKCQGSHLERLLEEQKIRRQPLGGARQHLNTHLARQRASQLEHVQLARLFARMGHASAAKEQSDFVLVPAARLISRIDCLITAGNHSLAVGKLDEAATIAPQVMDLIHRGIGCGAIVDPWNILGFAGNFARFHGPDSAVHDHRVDDLVNLMEHVFALQSRIWREAAGAGRKDLCPVTEQQFKSAADWWRQFAAHEVSDVQATDPQETFQSASLVATALGLWHAGGSETGDVKFWAPHAALFDSPKAYALVVESLLERADFVASMALLVHWLSQSSRVGLQSGSASFSDLARQWLQRLESTLSTSNAKGLGWSVAQKFFDYLEANGDQYWQPPSFRLTKAGGRRGRSGGDLAISGGVDFNENDEEGNDQDALFRAAYDDVVYKDSTDDGVESETSEEGSDNKDELQLESNRLSQHLTFLNAIAQMWKGAALSSQLRCEMEADSAARSARFQAIEAWASHAAENRKGLLKLLEEASGYKIARGGADQESMSRYDRQRLIKESLLERIVATALETSDARRLLLATMRGNEADSDLVQSEIRDLPEDDRLAVEMFGYLLHGEHQQVEKNFSRLLAALRPKRLLYIPLARGGDPAQIYSVRLRRRVLSHLLVWLPRQGLFFQACQLIETARYMEHQNPVGMGAVTEFDSLFHLGYKAMVRAAVENAYSWRVDQHNHGSRRRSKKHATRIPDLDKNDGDSLGEFEPNSEELIIVLEQLTEVLLGSWLQHSRTLRLSVLESMENGATWKQLVDFIQRFGGPIFTQGFLKLGNVRAILHQGVGRWLDKVAEEGFSEEISPLLEAIDVGQISREQAEKLLGIVLEAIIDHYSEYRDYNSTTTQSDRGEMLYMLLDFLRLRVRYDRVCWNLKPIFWTHEVLVRSGCHQTAQQWRRALAERINRESEMYLEELAKLQQKYAMRMPTVADRLEERFLRPMTVDRMKALVGPSIRHFRETGKPSSSFDLLIEECKLMMEQPTGVGLDVPQWLSSLEEEVDRVLENQRGFEQRPQHNSAVTYRYISCQQIVDQLASAAKQIKTPNLTKE